MNLNEISNAVFETLSESLSGVYVIKAYPYSDKPAGLERPVTAVYPAESETEAVSLGSSEQYGIAKVKTEVYVPSKLGSAEVLKTAEKAVNAVTLLSPAGINISSVKNDDRLNCLYLSCVFSFDYYAEVTED